MKKTLKYPKQIKQISLISSIVLIVLLLISLAVNIVNANRLMHQMDEITEHPFQIVVATGSASTSIARMRVQTERLLYDNMPDTVAKVQQNLTDLSQKLDGSIAIIRDKYLGDTAVVAQLEINFSALKEAHAELLSYAAADIRSEDEIIDFCEKEAYPLYDKIELQIEDMSQKANEKFFILYEEAEEIRIVTIVLSAVVVVIVLGALAIYQSLL